MIANAVVLDADKYQLIRNLCLRYINPQNEIDELVNDMWLELIGVDKKSHVITKTKSRLIDRFRKKQRHNEHFVPESVVEPPELADFVNADNVSADQLNLLIKRSELSSYQREILYQRHYLGRDFRDISADMKVGLSKLHGEYHAILSRIRLANDIIIEES